MGLNESITLSFMVVGHTKFSPDSCFGLLKQKFRQTPVDTLSDIADVVKTSAICNEVEVVGWEDGIPIISTYDWQTYFADKMSRVKGIKKYHTFCFTNNSKGSVACRENSDDTEIHTIKLVKDESWEPSSSILPAIIQPKGLDPKRQWYLYDKIRPFCTTETAKDTTCPLPFCPNPCSSRQGSPAPPSSPPTLSSRTCVIPPSSPVTPAPKKRRICGKCGTQGHNSRTCKQ